MEIYLTAAELRMTRLPVTYYNPGPLSTLLILLAFKNAQWKRKYS